MSVIGFWAGVIVTLCVEIALVAVCVILGAGDKND